MPETSTPPGSHSCSSRAATLTPSPSRSSPSTTTSPRLTPIRNTIRRSAGDLRLRLGDDLLDRDRAGHGIDHRGELDDGAVAHQLDDAALVLGQQRVDRGLAQRLDRGQRASLVGLDQARVADDVGGQDRHQPALGTGCCRSGLHGRHLGGEQVAALGHRLEHLLRLVAERPADVADALGDRFVGDHHIGPDRRYDRVAVHKLSNGLQL